jgi:hypothetical protein
MMISKNIISIGHKLPTCQPTQRLHSGTPFSDRQAFEEYRQDFYDVCFTSANHIEPNWQVTSIVNCEITIVNAFNIYRRLFF